MNNKLKKASISLAVAISLFGVGAGAITSQGATAAISSSTANFGLQATQSGNQATITWNNSSYPSNGWEVKRDGKDIDGYGEWKESISASRNSYTFNDLIKGATYNFTLTNKSTGQTQVVSVIMGQPTVVPSDFKLQVTQSGSSAIATWDTSANPSSGWKIARDGKDSDGYGEWTDTVSGTTGTYKFNQMVNGATYNIKLTNLNTGKSQIVTIVMGKTTTPTPTTFGLKTAMSGTSSVIASWNASSNPSSGWEIKRDGKDNTGYGEWKEKVSGNVGQYKFDKMVSGSTYTITLTNLSTGKVETSKITVPGGSTTPTPAPTTTTPTPIPTTPPPVNSGQKGALSGMPWNSGLFPMHKANEVKFFENARGAKADVVTIFPERKNWSSMQNGWVIDSERIPSDYRGTLDVGVPLFPDDGNVNAAARGDYNEQWTKFAQMIAAKYPNAYIRLGWEMNLPGWHAHANPQNAEQWKQAYRQAVGAIRKGGPGLKIAWVVNEGPGQTGTQDARMFYPGDQYVDFIGMDAYDWWPGYTNSSNIAKHRDSAYGWNFWLNFAKQHNKKFVLPEWGIAPKNSNSGGDNPMYIDFVYNWLNSNRDWIEYESYFQETDSYIGSDLFYSDPKASAAYKAQIAKLKR